MKLKLAFSTIGCPDWKWEEIYACAKDLGLDGVEVRGVGNEIFAARSKPFLPENRAATMAKLRESGIAIPCLTTGCAIGNPDKVDASIAELREYIDLAADIGTPYVRVMAPTDLDCAAELYGAMCDYAAEKDVHPLIETNGPLADSHAMLAFLQKVNRPNMGVLWDVHHPYRYFNEQPAETYALLKPYIRHLHVKDSVMQDGKVSYRMMGRGDVPVLEVLKLLQDEELYVTLEWVKRWNPDLSEPGIVFPQFAMWMQFYMQ